MKRSAFSAGVIVLLAARTSLAGDPLEDFPDPDAPANLVQEAQLLAKKGRWAEACPKLEESLRRKPAIETQLELAECNARIGKIASARAGFLDVAARAKATNQIERAKSAAKRAKALEAHLSRVVFEVQNPPDGLQLKCDGIPIDAARWGTEIALDPGNHRVIASVPGKPRWDTTVTTMEGKIARVEVPRSFAETVSVAPAVTVATPVVAIPTIPATPQADDDVVSVAPQGPTVETPAPPVVGPPKTTQRTAGWIVAAAGAAGLGVGGGFALASLGARNDARDHCAGDACDATGVALREDAIVNGDIATIFTTAGVALLAGGLALMLTAPKR